MLQKGARSTLQSHIYNLRAAPGNDVVLREASGYRLIVTREQVDAWRFEDEVATSRGLVASRPAEAADRLRAALALWRGTAYGKCG